MLESEKARLLKLEEELGRPRHRAEGSAGGRRQTRSGGRARTPGSSSPHPAHSSSSAPPVWAKTEDGARAGRVLFDDERALVRALTCRSTWRSTRVARMIGAPPGYVGYEEGGQLNRGAPAPAPIP